MAQGALRLLRAIPFLFISQLAVDCGKTWSAFWDYPVAISATGLNSGLAIGYTKPVTATGRYSDGSTRDISAFVSIDSSNKSVADSNGRSITGLQFGTTTAKVSWGDLSDSFTIRYCNLAGSFQCEALALTGIVSTVAGITGTSGSADGSGLTATFGGPDGLTGDGTYLYIADRNNHVIRRMTLATGEVTTLAGMKGVAGFADGIGEAALFNSPIQLTTDGENLYVVELNNHTVRKIVISTRAVSLLAGSPGLNSPIGQDGAGTNARFNLPNGIIFLNSSLYISDYGNHTLRKLSLTDLSVTTIAGQTGISGTLNGIGAAARFNFPTGLTSDGSKIYVADQNNHAIRSVQLSDLSVTTLAGQIGIQGSANGIGAAASFDSPTTLTTDGQNLYVADYTNHTVRRITLPGAVVTTLAGTAGTTAPAGQNGSGATARFNNPHGITHDGTALYVGERGNFLIRKIQ